MTSNVTMVSGPVGGSAPVAVTSGQVFDATYERLTELSELINEVQGGLHMPFGNHGVRFGTDTEDEVPGLIETFMAYALSTGKGKFDKEAPKTVGVRRVHEYTTKPMEDCMFAQLCSSLQANTEQEGGEYTTAASTIRISEKVAADRMFVLGLKSCFGANLITSKVDANMLITLDGEALQQDLRNLDYVSAGMLWADSIFVLCGIQQRADLAAIWDVVDVAYPFTPMTTVAKEVARAFTCCATMERFVGEHSQEARAIALRRVTGCFLSLGQGGQVDLISERDLKQCL
jgi:hypothetical protein